MEDKRVDGIEQDATAFMAGGGISGALMRSVDWARTPLGPIGRHARRLHGDHFARRGIRGQADRLRQIAGDPEPPPGPDVAFIDIGLPVMDSYDLAERLRQISSVHELRLVALTGYGQEADRVRARAAGFDHHLVKPVDFAAVEVVLGARSKMLR